MSYEMSAELRRRKKKKGVIAREMRANRARGPVAILVARGFSKEEAKRIMRARRGQVMPRPRKHSERESSTGRYESFDAMCVCGHSKGNHTAGEGRGSAGDCIYHEADDAAADAPFCSCEKYRKARKVSR